MTKDLLLIGYFRAVLQINFFPLPVTMNRKIKKTPVKLNIRQSQ